MLYDYKPSRSGENAADFLDGFLKGAKASAAIYSIIETAKANGLNVYTYLKRLLLYMPSTGWQSYPEELDDLMPWSAKVPYKTVPCKLKTRLKYQPRKNFIYILLHLRQKFEEAIPGNKKSGAPPTTAEITYRGSCKNVT